jgi:hypothetical protein
LILFFPWALVLGFAGIGIFFMSIHESSTFWKWIGIAGALVAVVGSLGRVSVVAFALAIVFHTWVRSRSAAKWLLISILSIAVIVMVSIFNISPFDIVSELSGKIVKSRPYSSEVRLQLNEETWKGIEKSPIVGNGWQGERIFPNVPMPIGSHSTILGVLYTGGISTFLFFCSAVLITFASLVKQNYIDSIYHISAMTVFFAFLMFTYTESVQLFIFPTLLVFLWIGWALSPVIADGGEHPHSLEPEMETG